MIVEQTVVFRTWHEGLRDRQAARIIAARMRRLEQGLLGNTRSLGSALSELKIDYGPGYRLYFTMRGTELVWLLCGGDKSTQRRDIDNARDLLGLMEDGR